MGSALEKLNALPPTRIKKLLECTLLVTEVALQKLPPIKIGGSMAGFEPSLEANKKQTKTSINMSGFEPSLEANKHVRQH